MAGALLCEVTLPHVDGITRDEVVNTFPFITTADPPSTLNMTDAADAIEAFYNTIPSGLNAVAGWLNASRSRASNACSIRYYDIIGHLDGSPHGSPLATSLFTLGAQASGGGALPAEVACVLTSQAAYGSDVEFAPGARPRARDRGRLYLGPLTSAAVHLDSTTQRASVNTQLIASWQAAGAALKALASSVGWSVWSRRNAILKLIIQGWVDDAFDTHRKRGEDPLFKFNW
jgi:hypothetical protein